MLNLHIFPNFDDDRMKNLGLIWENVQNMLILSDGLTAMTSTLERVFLFLFMNSKGP